MGKYSHLLDNILESNIDEVANINDKVLIIDSMNLFLRNFATNNKLNKDGVNIGGLCGYLRSLGFMVKQHQPTRIIIVFDGEGSTISKKNIHSDYKGTRKIKRITNWTNFDSLEEESYSIKTQLLRLIDYLKQLPLNIVVIDKLEADDIIAYIAPKFNHSIILSADQDFLQLVSDKITVYSPIKKIYYTPKSIFEQYKIWPQNLLTKKCIMGDVSDNVPKVPKLGEKKLLSLFPELSGVEEVTLAEIIQKSYDKCDKIPLYGNVYNFRTQLKINEKLMDLKNPIIPEQEKDRLDLIFDELPYPLNRSKFISLNNEDKLENNINMNLEFWIDDCFSYIQLK